MARRGFAIIFTLLGIAFFLSIAGLFVLYVFFMRAPSVPSNALLKLSIGGELTEVAIIGGRPEGDALLGSDPVNPCGRCRQILNEAAERSQTDIRVHCASGDGSAVKSYRLSELLPAAFGPKDLGLID